VVEKRRAEPDKENGGGGGGGEGEKKIGWRPRRKRWGGKRGAAEISRDEDITFLAIAKLGEEDRIKTKVQPQLGGTRKKKKKRKKVLSS